MKRRERNKGQARAEAVQIRESGRHPFGVLDRYVPLGAGELQLYRAIREAVPILDAAIWKLIRLAGGVAVKCGEPAAQAGLERFLRTVPTGRGQRGIQSFLDCYLDSMLTCGRGVGELVLDCQGREIAALLCAGPEQVEIREGDSPLDFQLCARGPGGTCEPLPWQELLLFTPFQPETEHPYGVSLLRSMPFLTDILLKIYQATGMNWERMGNVRFAVICRPGEGEGAYAQERCRQIAGEWSAAMQAGKQGAVRDFVAVGDLDIKVIGADNQVLDSQVPVRQMLEQIVAKLGLPPFILGLSWSTTERMSQQQAEILASELESYRELLNAVILRICRYHLNLKGMGGALSVKWKHVSMSDEVEQARAELLHMQAKQIEQGLAQEGKAREEEDEDELSKSREPAL